MERILIIGCPGSGKSTLSKQVSKRLNLPILHLDRIFHIDNQRHISREELTKKIRQFIDKNKRFIIDGNYSGTLDLRMEHADTIIFFDIPTNICLKNVMNRIMENKPRDDIAPGFDNSVYNQDFIDYIKTFKKDKQPYIEECIKEFDGEIIRIESYNDAEKLLKQLRNK